MPKLKNRKIVLASRPLGEPTEDNFRLIEREEPDQPDRGLLLKTLWLSLDPYMRGVMSEGESYTDPATDSAVGIGEVMDGGPSAGSCTRDLMIMPLETLSSATPAGRNTPGPMEQG